MLETLLFSALKKKSHMGKYLTIRQTRTTVEHKTNFGKRTDSERYGSLLV